MVRNDGGVEGEKTEKEAKLIDSLLLWTIPAYGRGSFGVVGVAVGETEAYCGQHPFAWVADLHCGQMGVAGCSSEEW